MSIQPPIDYSIDINDPFPWQSPLVPRPGFIPTPLNPPVVDQVTRFLPQLTEADVRRIIREEMTKAFK